MDLFDLVFILLFLTALASLLTVATAALRGHGARARRILRRLLVCAGLYLGIVFAVSLAARPRVLKPGDPQCNDDWCIAVAGVNRTPGAYNVTLRISSRARRVAQRENGVSVYLLDGRGRRYDAVPDPAAVPLNTLLQPGESVDARRVFNVPADAREVGLVVDHGSGFPGCFIIGENTWFHKPTLVRLD